MDMTGKILHTWDIKSGSWCNIELCENGDLLVVVKDVSLNRLDWDSNIIWTKKGRFHHDIDIADNGDLYILSRNNDEVVMNGRKTTVKNDYLTILTPDGKIKREFPFF